MLCPKCKRRIPRKSAFCLYCGAGVGAPAAGEAPLRACILCGRPLPEEADSDLCDGCLYGMPSAGETAPEPDLLPAFDECPPVPKPSRRGSPRWRLPLVLLAALLLALGLFWFLRPHAQGYGPSHTASASELSEEERYAVTCAQEMVRGKAYDPGSVHFHQQGLEVSEEDGVYTVVQRFDRDTASGETVTASYTAALTLSGSLDGYTPLMLQVGGDLLYDNRG